MILVFSLLILDSLVVYLVCKAYIASQKRAYSHATALSESRLLYIRSLMNIVYTYSHRTDQLLLHLKTEMCIRKILNYGIIEDNCGGFFEPDLQVRHTDKQLFALYKEGFTPQELCVIFNLNNLNSVYVKCHRIKKKMESVHTKPDLAGVSPDIS